MEHNYITYLHPDLFLQEANRWGITRESLIRVRMMQLGSYIYCRFFIPYTNELIETRVSLDEFNKFQFMNIFPIAVPSVWEIPKERSYTEESHANSISSNIR